MKEGSMGGDTILMDRRAGQTRAALMQGRHLLEVAVERPGLEGITGNIYLGRVEKVAAGLNAAFMDIGEKQSAYLAVAEIRPPSQAGGTIGDYLSEGDGILVQVLREPFEDKGAKLTTRFTIAGALLAHTPAAAEVRVSRRLASEDERRRLQAVVEGMTAGGGGFIVRTAAQGADEAELAFDAAALSAAWAEIKAAAGSARAPARLRREPEPALRFLRDRGGPHIKRIVVEDAALLNRARAYLEQVAPPRAGRLEPWPERGSLFEAWQAEEQIEAALEDTVPLPSGGSLVISPTPALTAIDVNTGGRTAIDANLEAAAEIAGQIRLRNLAGLLVVDFVSMGGRAPETRVLEALRRAVAPDPAGVHVVGFTRFGLLEMTRRRQGFPLARILTAPCPACDGSGRVARKG